MDISLYGSTGFIGHNFMTRYGIMLKPENHVFPIDRESRKPHSTGNILYTISTTHNYNVFDDVTLDVRTNLLVLAETLEAWRQTNPNGTFNFISSWFVYGSEYHNDYMGAQESDPCHPKGFYSITKHCAEQLVASYATTFDLKYRILRLSNVLGDDPKVSAKKNALQYLIKEMKQGNPIKLYDDGLFYRNYIHVDDCCNAIYRVMSAGKDNEIYNIGGGNYKFRDMIMYAAEKLGYDVNKITRMDAKEFHKKVQARSFKMDTSKLEGIGFESLHDMEAMIDSILDT
jgi:nucleoside-diphosphate-sugar epimerase